MLSTCSHGARKVLENIILDHKDKQWDELIEAVEIASVRSKGICHRCGASFQDILQDSADILLKLSKEGITIKQLVDSIQSEHEKKAPRPNIVRVKMTKPPALLYGGFSVN